MVNINPNPDYDPSFIRLTGKAKYDCSHIKLEETPKPKTYQELYIEEHNKLTAGPKTWIEWIKDDPKLNFEQKLGFMFKAGYEVALEKARKTVPEPSAPPVSKTSKLAAFKQVIRSRWRTILIVATATTLINFWAPFYTYNHTERGGWSRINRLSGHVQFYHPGYGWQ